MTTLEEEKRPTNTTTSTNPMLKAKCLLFQWLSVYKNVKAQELEMMNTILKKKVPNLMNSKNDIFDALLNDVNKALEADTPNNEQLEFINYENGKIKDLLSKKYNNFKQFSTTDRSLGVLLGVTVGDVLGSPVEGTPYEYLTKKFTEGGVRNFMPGAHMGMAGITRYGQYTDDTTTTLGLALGLIDNYDLLLKENKRFSSINCELVSLRIAQFWKFNVTERGLPKTAKRTLEQVLESDGKDCKKTGYSQFSDGSYANGGAMRISSMPIVLRNYFENKKSNKQLYKQFRKLISDSIIATHCHEEAIDGAVIIARIIIYCFHITKQQFKANQLYNLLLKDGKIIYSKNMKKIIENIFNEFSKLNENEKNDKFITKKDIKILNKYLLLQFQIKSIEAVPLVLYCLLRWYQYPENCIINCVNLGGDNDTTGSILGGIIGALYGTYWIPNRWYNNIENDYGTHFMKYYNEQYLNIDKNELYKEKMAYGRDLIEDIAIKLANIELCN